jgi:hypothetical protein
MLVYLPLVPIAREVATVLTFSPSFIDSHWRLTGWHSLPQQEPNHPEQQSPSNTTLLWLPLGSAGWKRACHNLGAPRFESEKAGEMVREQAREWWQLESENDE